jgi:hypothetical protein
LCKPATNTAVNPVRKQDPKRSRSHANATMGLVLLPHESVANTAANKRAANLYSTNRISDWLKKA